MERREDYLLSQMMDELVLMRYSESSLIWNHHMKKPGLHVLTSMFEAMEARFVACPYPDFQEASVVCRGLRTLEPNSESFV
jgi:hypothetical protein